VRVAVSSGVGRVPACDLDRPTGGVVAGALGLCFSLAGRGHEVHLFGRCANPGALDGVAFHDRSELVAWGRQHPPDALIVIPELMPLLLPIPTRARVVWSGNAYRLGDYALSAPWEHGKSLGRKGEKRARLYSLGLLHPAVDRLVVGSEWQADHMHRATGMPRHKITVSYLGVPLQFYQSPPPVRHRHRLVYTSQARRGLDVLLQAFPRIRASVPQT
jgi:hypothetical protein